MLRVKYEELHAVLCRVLERTGMAPERATRCAALFADATLDGVPSHGLNRVPGFLRTIARGIVDVQARAERIEAHGAVERWNGHRGPGNLNAWDSMARAIALSRQHGVGCVALSNTNHWMRSGSYGWQAADAGALAICWSNTLPNLPPWGASEPRIGNNPLVIAAPRPPAHVVVDTAMSQFSYGALDGYRRRGEPLPVAGGYNVRGELTRDAEEIVASRRLLPIGCWKGSSLAVMLDVLAAALSGGRATWQVPMDADADEGISQVFIAFDAGALGGPAAVAAVVDGIVDHLKAPDDAGEVVYPGERAYRTRMRNLAEGIPVDAELWGQVLNSSILQ